MTHLFYRRRDDPKNVFLLKYDVPEGTDPANYKNSLSYLGGAVSSIFTARAEYEGTRFVVGAPISEVKA